MEKINTLVNKCLERFYYPAKPEQHFDIKKDWFGVVVLVYSIIGLLFMFKDGSASYRPNAFQTVVLVLWCVLFMIWLTIRKRRPDWVQIFSSAVLLLCLCLPQILMHRPLFIGFCIVFLYVLLLNVYLLFKIKLRR